MCIRLSGCIIFFLIQRTLCQIVTTSLGSYQGVYITTPGGFRMEAYLSVPYAQTPPGRFTRTQPATSFSGTFNATFYQQQCAHWGPDSKTLSPDSGEDCLHLKILAPASRTCCLPVMVWYIGGGFNDGEISLYDNGALGDNFVSKGVILIQVNFRQGPFGFFTTGTSDATGNYGVWDALEALRFLRNYVRSFGGDATRLTIMGQEGGAVMAELLHLSPSANGLYSAAIFISGTAFDPVITRNDALNIARSQRLAITVGCDNNTAQSLWNRGRRGEVVSCLRNVPVANLTSAIGRADIIDTSSAIDNYYWRPRVDGAGGIFPDSFENLAARRLNVPVLMGVMRDEWMTELVLFPSTGANGTININSSWNVPDFVRQTCDNQITTDPDIYGIANVDRLRSVCKNRFVNSVLAGSFDQQYRSNPNFWLQRAGLVATSLHTMAPMVKSASYMRRAGNRAVYLYSWDYDRSDQGSYWVPLGALRYLELTLLENVFFTGTFNFTANDNKIRSVFGDLTTNFARFYNPTPVNYTVTPQWLPYGNDYYYLSFKVNPEMRSSFYQGDALCWLNSGAVRK